jgi:hypothetical protein
MGLFGRKTKSKGTTVGAAYDPTMWRFPSQFVQPGERPVGQMVVKHSNGEYLANMSDQERRAYSLVDQMEVFPGSGTIGGTRGMGTIWFTDRQVIVGKPQHRDDLTDQVIPYSSVNSISIDRSSSLLMIVSDHGTFAVTCPTAQGMQAAEMLVTCWQRTR